MTAPRSWVNHEVSEIWLSSLRCLRAPGCKRYVDSTRVVLFSCVHGEKVTTWVEASNRYGILSMIDVYMEVRRADLDRDHTLGFGLRVRQS